MYEKFGSIAGRNPHKDRGTELFAYMYFAIRSNRTDKRTRVERSTHGEYTQERWSMHKGTIPQPTGIPKNTKLL